MKKTTVKSDTVLGTMSGDVTKPNEIRDDAQLAKEQTCHKDACREVARRRDAEQTVKRQSSMLEAFFAHTINPVAFMDLEFNFIRVNNAFARVDRKSPEDFIGKNHFELYPHTENQKIFRWVVKNQKSYQAHAKPFRYPQHPEKGVTYWDWSLTPLLDKFGETAYLVLNLENVTERQEAMEKLELRARQLQQLAMELSQAENRERQRIAEVLHDDLQQLLVAAKIRLEMLCSKKQQDHQFNDEVERIIDLLAQSISRSRSLSHELNPPILSGSGIQKALEWLATEMGEKYSLSVFIDVTLQSECESKALQAFAYRAVQEMLFNVVKHADIDKAHVRVRNNGNHLRILVADRGRGFFREQFREAGGNKGGFGLFSIRERVQFLGGHFKILTAPGKGSCVAFSIPLGSSVLLSESSGNQSDSCENIHVKNQEPGSMSAKRLKVMLVDDHKIMREGLHSILADEPDLEIVAEASNGREAVTLASELAPDVIIMDVSMPVMDGIEATRLIKSGYPGIRVIGLSMFDETSMSERMKEAGADDYLCKTGPPRELLAAIRIGLNFQK
jgi:PAS domain S-box-containing protein